MDIAPSGELGVSSSEEGKLWVWEADTGEPRVCAINAEETQLLAK